MISRYAGRCAECGKSYAAGAEIRRAGAKWAHAVCGDADTETAPATAGRSPARMLSRFDGRCTCGSSVAAGAPIAYQRGVGVVGCEACAFGAGADGAVDAFDLPATVPVSTAQAVASIERAVGELTAEQRAVVLEWDGGIGRLVATAGSGKTRSVIVTAAMRRLEGTPPEAILLTSFTYKAAAEMTQRMATLAGSYMRGTVIGTFHSAACGWLKEHYEMIGDFATVRRLENPIDGNGRVATDQYDVVEARAVPRSLNGIAQRCLSAEALSPWLPEACGAAIEGRPTAALADDYLAAVGLLRAACIGPDASDEAIAEVSPLVRLGGFYRALDASCRALGVSTFDEWIFLAARLATTPESGFAARVGARYRYLIVDEAQDNNLAQLRLALELARAGAGNLLFVGDVRQSIYAFRGAEPRFLADLERIAAPAEVRTWYLTTNWRSVGPIVALSNELVRGAEWAIGPDAVPAAAGADISVEAAIGVWSPGGSVEEAAEIAEHAGSLIEALPEGRPERRPVAVLARANATLGLIEAALLRRQVPYVVTRGCGFFGRREIKATLAYLRCASGRSVDADVIRVASSTPSRFLGRGFADATAGAFLGGGTVAGCARSIGATNYRWRRGANEFAFDLDRVRAAQSCADAIGVAVDIVRSAFTGAEEQAGAAASSNESRLDNLTALLDIAKSFDTVRALLDYADRGQLVRSEDGPTRAVVLSTVHGAKGLEYDTVILPQAVKGQYPHGRAETELELEEERRVEYVAVTRAARRLIFSVPMLDGHGHATKPCQAALIARAMLSGQPADAALEAPALTQPGELPAAYDKCTSGHAYDTEGYCVHCGTPHPEFFDALIRMVGRPTTE